MRKKFKLSSKWAELKEYPVEARLERKHILANNISRNRFNTVYMKKATKIGIKGWILKYFLF